MYISIFVGLNVKEYVEASTQYCTLAHQNCKECSAMLLVANAVLENGYVTLKSAFTKSFPNVDYNVTYVRRRLLQMPLACIQIQFNAGLSECYLVEHSPNTNYNALQGLIASVIQKTSKENPAPVSKEVVKELLGLCQSDRERECMRYAAFRFSGCLRHK
jgi:hypothetical protein